MSDLCTACLSVGRSLFSIQGSDIQQLYTQILNEISISGEMLSACMQVCWECRAVLERFQRFKKQAQECYTELLDNMQQSTPYNHHRSRLGTRRVHSISYPETSSSTSELHVKCEMEVKCELSDDTHREPDTFVDSVALDREPRTAKEKRTMKKKSKHKVKIRKKKREVRSKESSDAGSDADFDDATESFTKREFPCAQCDESFVEERELERHIDRLHIVKTLKRKSKQKVKVKKKKAARSKESSDAGSDVDFEETESLAKREFACAQCDESFVEERELERHTDSVHTVKTLKKESSDAGYDVDFEETESLAKREFPCAQCEESFVEERELERHIDSSHIVEKAVKPNGVRRPRNMEPLPEKPQCVECGKMFSSRKTYRYHLNVLHRGQNRYPCPRCGKVYQWKSNLGRHMRTHKARDNNELHCALCDKRFASVATYRQHLRVSRRHVSENDFTFMCNECGKKFVNKTRLRDHIDWEHLNKIKFRCQLCNKPFKCHTSLYVHLQNVHKNKEKKENLCHVCGKSYPNAAKLKYHIVAMHTSETPYRCAQCGAAFGWYSSLYRHVREVHHKMKLQPNRIRKQKIPKANDLLPPLLGPS